MIEYFLVQCDDDPTVHQSLEILKSEIDEEYIKIVSGRRTAHDAFNAMIDNATADYVFQVDGDQFMYSGFSDRIHNTLNKEIKSNSRLSMYMYSSYDSFEERNIWASCKIYNIKAIKETGCRFKDQKGCDRQILRDLSNKGYSWKTGDLNKPIAIHALKECGPPYIFSRFQNRICKDGFNADVNRILKRSVDRYKKTKDIYSAGMIMGCYVPYTHNGEVSRENQKTYKERQLLEDPENNFQEIDKIVLNLIDKHKL